MFYELQNSWRSDLLKIERGIDFSFPSHLHESFELVLITSGEMLVRVDNVEYTLTSGDAILIFPNQLHELVSLKHSSHFLCIFSTTLVRAFSKMCAGKVPVCNRFKPDKFYIDCLMRCNSDEALNTIAIKGTLYSLCAEFNKTAKYTDQTITNDGLLAKIFKYVEDNFQANCTLEALSSSISYNYVYLSRFFKQCTNISFIDYVNRYRIDEACYLLKNSESSILQIAYDCGFDSLRSFNRNFKKIMDATPSEYRKKY